MTATPYEHGQWGDATSWPHLLLCQIPQVLLLALHLSRRRSLNRFRHSETNRFHRQCWQILPPSPRSAHEREHRDLATPRNSGAMARELLGQAAPIRHQHQRGLHRNFRWLIDVVALSQIRRLLPPLTS